MSHDSKSNLETEMLTWRSSSDLAVFYTRLPEDPKNFQLLRGFYGCIAKGLSYLHSIKIRHRDIKPENILVKGSDVYLTDFGISLDWESLSRSTTTDDTGKSWIYCAPEVAHIQKRNASSDVWSLGCVFLEMSTVLKGQSLDAMRQYFRKLNNSHRFYQNISAFQEWSQNLRVFDLASDNLTIDWASSMMQEKPESRPSADDICDRILNASSNRGDKKMLFCGECCAVNSDGDSAAESVSDGDIWAEDVDDETASRQTTDTSSKSANTAGEPLFDKVPIAQDSSNPSPSKSEIAASEQYAFPRVMLVPECYSSLSNTKLED